MTYNVFGGTLNIAQLNSAGLFVGGLNLFFLHLGRASWLPSAEAIVVLLNALKPQVIEQEIHQEVRYLNVILFEIYDKSYTYYKVPCIRQLASKPQLR